MVDPAKAKRLTEAEIEQIVDQCLDRVPVRDIARTFGVNKDTVTLHWHKWLDATTEERREQLERKRSEVIARLDSIADAARQGVTRVREWVDDPEAAARAEAKFLSEERQALRILSTVAGYDAPIKLQTSSTFTPISEAEAAEALNKL